MSEVLRQITQYVIEGQLKEITSQVEQTLAEGFSAGDIINQGLLEGMAVVGDRCRDGQVFLPEVLMSAKAMKNAMAVLEPLLLEGEHSYRGRVVIGTVIRQHLQNIFVVQLDPQRAENTGRFRNNLLDQILT